MSDQSGNAKAELLLSEFEPESELVVATTDIRRPKFTVIDAHSHLDDVIAADFAGRPVSEILDRMDEASIAVLVDLAGWRGSGALQANLDRFKAIAPERFVHFAGIDWASWLDRGNSFPEWAVDRLRQQVRWGAQGLKIWKDLGLSVRDHTGRLVAVDDTRLDDIWAAAAELALPVMIHVADPVAFFKPRDGSNERYEELAAHPEWHVPATTGPGFLTIMDALRRVVLRHPRTTFIGAHVGCYAENLGWVAALLDVAPNFHVDISSRISELGRQPYSARRFFERYADRTLFGTDNPPRPDVYRTYYRFLETDDEYFNYFPAKTPNQGRWRIYGLHLPDDILRKVYYENAARLLRLTPLVP